MLHVLAGEFKSRILKTPTDDAITRPMGSRTKEGLFNVLRGWFEGARVLDLFAGVGTLGLEAVSRGAIKVFMVEKDRKIFALLRDNIESLGCGERAIAVQADALGEAAIMAAQSQLASRGWMISETMLNRTFIDGEGERLGKEVAGVSRPYAMNLGTNYSQQ